MAIVFGALFFVVGWTPIYCVVIALFLGAAAAVACRPDLWWNTLLGGLLFLGFYFTMFLSFTLIFPWFTQAWNLPALSGVIVIGVPLKELMFAFTFGMIRSGIYEDIRHYATR